MSDNLYFSRDTKMLVKDTTSNAIWEIPVLDGFSFSQATNATEVTLSEMETGGVSRRGRRLFTDSYAPAEFSFSTYVRPFKSAGGTPGTAVAGVYPVSDTINDHAAVEEILWAMMATNAPGYTPATGDYSSAGVTRDITDLNIDFSESNKSTVGTFELYFLLGAGSNDGSRFSTTTTTDVGGDGVDAGGGNFTVTVTTNTSGTAIQVGDVMNYVVNSVEKNAVVTAVNTTTITFTDDITDIAQGTAVTFSRQVAYKLDKAVINEASIDFEIDGIATINWTGNASIIEQVTPPLKADYDASTNATYYINEAITSTGNFIRNRLTSVTITSDTNLDGSGTAGNDYTLTLTGGNITISNNNTFLTPETLGTVNQPIGHVTGARGISGNMTCYLNTGDDSSSDLFKDLIAANTVVTSKFGLTFKIGGTNAPRLELACATAHLELPTHTIEDVISMDIAFHGLPSTISSTDEVTLKYVGA